MAEIKYIKKRLKKIETILVSQPKPSKDDNSPFYKLSEKFPDSIEILSALADYYSNKGDLDKAIGIIEKAFNQNKDSRFFKID